MVSSPYETGGPTYKEGMFLFAIRWQKFVLGPFWGEKRARTQAWILSKSVRAVDLREGDRDDSGS